MKTVTIQATETNAFDSFEITEIQLEQYAEGNISQQEILRICMKVLGTLSIDQLTVLKQESDEVELTLDRNLHSIVNLAIIDHIGEVA